MTQLSSPPGLQKTLRLAEYLLLRGPRISREQISSLSGFQRRRLRPGSRQAISKGGTLKGHDRIREVAVVLEQRGYIVRNGEWYEIRDEVGLKEWVKAGKAHLHDIGWNYRGLTGS